MPHPYTPRIYCQWEEWEDRLLVYPSTELLWTRGRHRGKINCWLVAEQLGRSYGAVVRRASFVTEAWIVRRYRSHMDTQEILRRFDELNERMDALEAPHMDTQEILRRFDELNERMDALEARTHTTEENA